MPQGLSLRSLAEAAGFGRQAIRSQPAMSQRLTIRLVANNTNLGMFAIGALPAVAECPAR